MTNKEKRKIRNSIIFWLIGFVFCVCMSILIWENLAYALEFCKSAVKVPATITKVEREYYGNSSDDYRDVMTVNYTYEGENYSAKTWNLPTAWETGKEIEIYIMPHNPIDIRYYGAAQWIPLTLAIIVLLFFVCVHARSLYNIVMKIKKQRENMYN